MTCKGETIFPIHVVGVELSISAALVMILVRMLVSSGGCAGPGFCCVQALADLSSSV